MHISSKDATKGLRVIKFVDPHCMYKTVLDSIYNITCSYYLSFASLCTVVFTRTGIFSLNERHHKEDHGNELCMLTMSACAYLWNDIPPALKI